MEVTMSSASSPEIFSRPFESLASIRLLRPLLLIVSIPRSRGREMCIRDRDNTLKKKKTIKIAILIILIVAVIIVLSLIHIYA